MNGTKAIYKTVDGDGVENLVGVRRCASASKTQIELVMSNIC